MLKRIQQDNDNGVLGLSFWTFIFKKERFVEFSNYKKKRISRKNVPAKMFPPNVFLKFFPPNFIFKSSR